jgi:thioredoxin-like negative regulator of GroEL
MENKSAKEFLSLVKAFDAHERPIVAKFGATWCPPCQEFAPTIKALSEDDSEFITVSVDIDDQRELALHMGVESVPTTFLIYKGLCIDSFEGVASEDDVRLWVKQEVSRMTVQPLEITDD